MECALLLVKVGLGYGNQIFLLGVGVSARVWSVG